MISWKWNIMGERKHAFCNSVCGQLFKIVMRPVKCLCLLVSSEVCQKCNFMQMSRNKIIINIYGP